MVYIAAIWGTTAAAGCRSASDATILRAAAAAAAAADVQPGDAGKAARYV